ncbi:MAG: hypothetical protein DMG83_16780 [Acidobacteria bacterium]|nr:MAG: hypothetical protein DMG83_16780 [Acidobacteriota bacterium]
MEARIRALSADVVLQKSIREGFGLIVAEAFWKGKPVVAGRAGGIPMRWIAKFAVGEGGVILMTEARGASNQKAKSRLGWEPHWRTWRDGFRYAVELEQRRVAA